jgi:hypothetical protein
VGWGRNSAAKATHEARLNSEPIQGGLVSGGEEALLMNASPQSPAVSLVTMKRASPPSP